MSQRLDDLGGRRGAPSQAPTAEAAPSITTDVENKIRDLRIFSHFGARGHLGQKIKGEIHPSIIRLGLLFAEYKITGANARCISALTAFKSVIADYVTPTNNSLSRHFMTYLSPQISYLTSARPMSVSLGNAIRWLKLQIGQIDIDLPEHAAKSELYARIDQYMQERILAADVAISTFGLAKIHDGDVVLTYARSSVVEKLLISAHRAGKRFEVIVVDSRPMLEGRNLLRTLAAAGIPCTYCILSALGTVMKDASIVFLGTHALHSNGALYSRAGTALVAMMANQHNVPVLACCETYKFSDSVNLDSFTKNELARTNANTSTGNLRDEFNLQLLNPLYDLTPPAYITAVVTEVGLIPVSSVPTVLSRETQAQ
ncbi:putative translation initiation factor eIF-2B subunit delta AltName: Full=eIF-2B GDP-GTP exchange factor subunit delta [Rhizoctonia solani AG-1 IB]|uniref:Translation initiation factor eIF2B subunit delta n=1 Tax=Thanatephorus cucumeris (strain AG1-IB / isolate 7/3/14) TaxID=1108050 RepID=M5BS06_THACB|nr:putative translation initiation factor eIF-2B subunit delta AltName: Full=eIF-2B GDP-GTP exchange factor subunit delta [Rhizoctonia solani AG-1 IB]